MPGRQMVVIRLDATKRIFWNFRSPEKTCWSASPHPTTTLLPCNAGCLKCRGRPSPAQSPTAQDRCRTPLSPTAFSQKSTRHLTGHSFIHPATT